MAETAEKAPVNDELVDEIRSWLSDNWDPELTVADWWERLGLAGWSSPILPENAYGRGLSRNDAVIVQNEIANFGALGAPAGLGLLLAAPTIASHGTQEQIDLYVRDIVTGQKAWCQLFSEPGAGSDLAGLTCKAVEDGDEYIVNGQKVWTTFGHEADLGMLIARTAPELPKHRGISWFAIDMDQPGIEVRPLVEMTGHALFNEVFLTDSRVPASALIGEKNNGWAVANTTLMNERAGLGTGGGSGGAGASAGTIVGNLPKRVGDFVSEKPKKKASSAPSKRPPAGSLSGTPKLYRDLAAGDGKNEDPTIRQDLVRLHILGELGRFNSLRVKAARAAGKDVPGMANISKLAMSDSMRLTRDIGLRIAGASGMLHAYKDDQKEAILNATGNPFLGAVTGMALWAQGPPIYGGTDQIQRNIIGERVLGLPKEANNDKTAAFADLPKNA